MSGHGNGADGDAIVLSVLLGILVGLACWSWRFVRAMAASAIASSRSITAVGARHGVGFRSLHKALDITSPSGTWVPCVGPAGRVKGFGEPHRNPATARHGA